MPATTRFPEWTTYLLVVVVTLLACAPLLETACFTLDDYRYLDHLRRIDAGEPGAWARAVIVENRWDDAWWVPADTFVRFFRPFVIATYYLDHQVWSDGPLGHTISNVLMHVVATCLVLALLRQLLGNGPAAPLGGLAFGTACVHFENLYYIPGRASVMATIGILAALLLHGRWRCAPTTARQLVIATVCGIAFFAKESAAVTPILIVARDALAPPAGRAPGLGGALRHNAHLLWATAVLAGTYLLVRTTALSPAGAGVNVFPYIHRPGEAGFLSHLGIAWLQYALAMSVGTFVHTFASSTEQVWAHATTIEAVLGLAGFHGLLVFGLLDRSGRWLVVLLLVTTLPMLPLYTSARHLYTGTAGYCGLLALACLRLYGHSRLRPAAIGVALVFVLWPGVRLATLLHEYPPTQSDSDPVGFMADMIERGDMSLDPGQPVYLLDFPGDWFKMQFAPASLAVALEHDLPGLYFLTATRMGGRRPIEVVRRDAHTIELHRDGAPILPFADGPGGRSDFAPGDRIDRPGFSVEVVEARSGRPLRIAVRFVAALSDVRLGRFVRDPEWRLVSVRP